MSVIHASYLLLLCLTSLARVINVTIDDEYGDERTGLKPQYEPAYEPARGQPGWWVATSKDLPESWNWSKVRNATLHNYTAALVDIPGNMTLSFNGTAIYIFSVHVAYYDIDVFFELDGVPQNVTPSMPPNVGAHQMLYNQPMFASGALEPGTHYVRVLFPANTVQYFDYALYTTEVMEETDHNSPTGAIQVPPDPSAKLDAPATSTPHPSSKVGPTVGGSLAGAIVFIALCIWAMVLRTRRARNASEDGGSSDRPAVYLADPPSSEPLMRSIPPTRNEKSDNPMKQTGRADDVSAAEDAQLPEGSRETIAFFRAELERVRAERERAHAESERARAETERVREENELLRRVAVPPPYSDGGRSNAVERPWN